MTDETPENLSALPTTLVCQPATVDPRSAAARALAEYLLSLVFVIPAPFPEAATRFQLQAVHEEWPEPEAELPYPCASILDGSPPTLDASNFVPTCLEDTFELYGQNTVLWKLAELEADFQVDFWCNSIPTREAIMGGLMRAFAPGEQSFGVILGGGADYFPETARIRATLMNYRRMDEPDPVYFRERRIQALIRIQAPVLDLRSTRTARFMAQSAVGPDVLSDPL